jgi:hypothetical protein
VLRDLTARTTLAATLYQSKHEAGQSCAEHGAIVAALEAGDTEQARQLMLAHIGNVGARAGGRRRRRARRRRAGCAPRWRRWRCRAPSAENGWPTRAPAGLRR